MDHFRGTLDECLDRLRMSPRSVLLHFIEFVKATPNTVTGWTLGTSKPPAGELLIRSVLFFNLLGWSVVEFEKTEPVAMDIAKLWMFELMTDTEIREELGYTSPGNSALLEYIYGKRVPIPSVRKLATVLVAQHRNTIDGTEDALREKYTLNQPQAATLVTDGEVVERLAVLLRTAQPLVDELLLDSHSDEDRENLRSLVGREEFVQLAVGLSALKSYRNRMQYLGR